MNSQRLSQLKAIHALVLKHYRHTPDRVEQWTPPPKSFNGRQLLYDDCDGFCLAVRKLLREQGIPSRLVYCEIERGGHLVVEVEGWILCNRQPTVIANAVLRKLKYQFKRISGYEAGQPWREVVS